VSVDRIEEMRAFPAPALEREAAPLERVEAVELRGVSFRYDGSEHEALADVDLALRRGERLAVVGAVGSGKSTLLKVMAGLLPPSRGELLVNGRRAEALSWRAIRARLGYVPQESHLFSETIRENVALAAPGAGGVPI